jgi:hypothetical protein
MPNQKERKFIAERYDQLFSDFDIDATSKKIAKEFERIFGERISFKTIEAIASEELPEGTHLHNFFDLMISDFKAKYKEEINEGNPNYLLFGVSSYIENEYGFGGKLNEHERRILSKLLEKRKDITFTDKKQYSRGISKGRLGYFK